MIPRPPRTRSPGRTQGFSRQRSSPRARTGRRHSRGTRSWPSAASPSCPTSSPMRAAWRSRTSSGCRTFSVSFGVRTRSAHVSPTSWATRSVVSGTFPRARNFRSGARPSSPASARSPRPSRRAAFTRDRPGGAHVRSPRAAGRGRRTRSRGAPDSPQRFERARRGWREAPRLHRRGEPGRCGRDRSRPPSGDGRGSRRAGHRDHLAGRSPRRGAPPHGRARRGATAGHRGRATSRRRFQRAHRAPPRRGRAAPAARGELMEEHTIDVGGRALCVAEAGDLEGHAVFSLHGTPGSRLFWHEVVDDAAKRGIRLIAYDRPGYGGSDPNPGRTVADAADDIAAIADGLGIDRYAVYGGSGGGPHALANAVRPERVVAVAALASVAPWGAEGLDWLDGMGQDNLDEFGATLEGEEPLRRYLEEQREAMLGGSPEGIAESLASLLCPPDLACLTGDLAQYFYDQIAEALRDGVDGWVG